MRKETPCRPWLIWWITAAFYLYELVLRVSPSVMTEGLMSSFNATSTLIGILVSFYYYSYTILQLPCGIMLDKLGAKNLLLVSALLCVVGSCLFASPEKIYIAQIGRFLVGAGSACAFVSCLQVATSLFTKKYFVILVGITNVMGTLGGLLGGFPIAKSVNAIGWRNTTYVLAAIGLIIIALIILFIPKNIKSISDNKNNESHSILKNILSLVRNHQIVLSGVISGLMYLPISAFAELWIVPFFMAKHGIDNEKASTAAATIFVGIAFGSIVLAMAAKKLGGYMRTIRLASLSTAIMFAVLIFGSDSLSTSLLIVFIIGFLTGAQPICFTCAKNNASSNLSGTTLALTNCIIMSLGAVFQPALGALLDTFWNGTVTENGMRIYDASCYKLTILTIPASLIIAYFISFFVKETINLEDE
ncbi:MAG: MFS transporter [Holosporales bacterium]|nr:MFS transporter [Holosporales bacterium]